LLTIVTVKTCGSFAFGTSTHPYVSKTRKTGHPLNDTFQNIKLHILSNVLLCLPVLAGLRMTGSQFLGAESPRTVDEERDTPE